MNETLWMAVIGVLILGALGQAQPAFEVASVRPSAGFGRQRTITSPGSLVMQNSTLNDCMRWAYGVMNYQISGSTAWMNRERYDLTAKAGEAASETELKTMLQALLADRFKLALHREQKDMQVLTMSVAKSGPKFRESTEPGEGNISTLNDVVTGKGATMAQLAELASGGVQAPVFDNTGLHGRYDFRIDAKAYLPAGGEGPGSPADRAAILITAFQDELGLKVESKKISVEVLVIDHAEKPSEN